MDIVETLGGSDLFKHIGAAFVFAMCVNILSGLLRKLIELIHPHLKNEDLVRTRLWRELILPTIPVLLGALLALCLVSFPYPEVFTVSVAMRVVYGLLAGFFSTWAYRIIKTLVQRKWNVALPDLATEEVESTKPDKPTIPPASPKPEIEP
jgi:hypothetical protein